MVMCSRYSCKILLDEERGKDAWTRSCGLDEGMRSSMVGTNAMA